MLEALIVALTTVDQISFYMISTLYYTLVSERSPYVTVWV